MAGRDWLPPAQNGDSLDEPPFDEPPFGALAQNGDSPVVLRGA
ncbi:hypothetical protein [Kribbella shirazensis]|uniref:Uncharacterized protein n=1 Tax=Kribbella shirazensis TaxID=1105143 RepID=A0A7X5VJQ9_9ACTN|nr:hypothetical protein [Kribbella shirazensis]NIK62339.1 hypothetical protein [Kribbella shirazensis]